MVLLKKIFFDRIIMAFKANKHIYGFKLPSAEEVVFKVEVNRCITKGGIF